MRPIKEQESESGRKGDAQASGGGASVHEEWMQQRNDLCAVLPGLLCHTGYRGQESALSMTARAISKMPAMANEITLILES